MKIKAKFYMSISKSKPHMKKSLNLPENWLLKKELKKENIVRKKYLKYTMKLEVIDEDHCI